MERWPNFFIVGAPRAGTTSLYEFLKRTKGVFMPSSKEPHYFSVTIDPSLINRKPIRDKKKYLQLFKKVNNEKAVGEASTSYLWDTEAPKLIYKKNPNSKIIIMLRDPVKRAFSYYLYRISNGRTYTFSDAIRESIEHSDEWDKSLIINGGWYAEPVKRYLDIFGKDQVKIVIFEEFIKNPLKKVKEVLEFLGVEENPPESVELAHNVLTKPKGKISAAILKNKKIRRLGTDLLPNTMGEFIVRKILGEKISKPDISKKDRLFLENLYREDVNKLKTLLGKDLPWFII